MSIAGSAKHLFRCAGDVQFDSTRPCIGHICDVRLKQYSETCNFLQYQRPLTPRNPYFFAQVRSLASSSIVTIGIAGPDISEDVHPGSWNNTVGCHSHTGHCYSSHRHLGNTEGMSFGIGDVFGVLVTYFGTEMSTVLFLKNGQPVAMRYLFEKDHCKYLPTVALENGPIDLGIVWPEAVGGAPKYCETDMLNWIVPCQVGYDVDEDIFFVKQYIPSGVFKCIQSPFPLSKDILHFEVVIQEVAGDGQGPIIAISTCSPISPPPTSELAKDFFKWTPHQQSYKLKAGQRMGWGVHYAPETRQSPTFNDKDKQLVLCYVSLDRVIVYAHMMMQPEGGWYPVIGLQQKVTKVKVDVVSCPKPATNEVLDCLYEKEHKKALQRVGDDNLLRYISESELRVSSSLNVDIGPVFVTLHLADGARAGVCALQYLCPLTPERRYYDVRINKLDEESMLCIGIAGIGFPLNKYPGRTPHSVGYHSRSGKIFTNEKSNANTQGHRLRAGDVVGLEVYNFHHGMSVVIFSKNYAPVGTRYLTLDNLKECYPTVAVYGNNGCEVDIDILFQNRVHGPKMYNATDISHWCIPEDATIVQATNTVCFSPNHNDLKCVQSPYPLNRAYNHFEVKVIDERDDEHPPPIIGLCTASPYDPPSETNFKQDILRFWAIDKASSAVKTGDVMGWGLLYPDDAISDRDEQLVICYLTLNRRVTLTRVMYQPPGGLFACVFLPSGLDRVMLDFGATFITEHPFTPLAVRLLVADAKRLIAEEDAARLEGKDVPLAEKEMLKYFKPMPAEADELMSDCADGTMSVTTKTACVAQGSSEGKPLARPCHVESQEQSRADDDVMSQIVRRSTVCAIL